MMTPDQIVLPPDLQAEVIKEIHSGLISSHLGEHKMLQQLKDRFYWPYISEDVKHWCKTWSSAEKSPNANNRALMQPWQAGYPLQIVAVVITRPFPESETGNNYILVVVDYFTKWMEAYAIPDQGATSVASGQILLQALPTRTVAFRTRQAVRVLAHQGDV